MTQNNTYYFTLTNHRSDGEVEVSRHYDEEYIGCPGVCDTDTLSDVGDKVFLNEVEVTTNTEIPGNSHVRIYRGAKCLSTTEQFYLIADREAFMCITNLIEGSLPAEAQRHKAIWKLIKLAKEIRARK